MQRLKLSLLPNLTRYNYMKSQCVKAFLFFNANPGIWGSHFDEAYHEQKN